MAISGASSYVPTVTEFLVHWRNANAELGDPDAIKVAGGVGIGRLEELRDALEAKRTELVGVLNEVEFASADMRFAKRTLLERFGQFSAQVRALYGGGVWEAVLPVAPSSTEAESKFLQPMVEAANVWARLEGEEAAIVLPGGFSLADFLGAIDVLSAAYRAWTVAGSNARVARAERNALQDDIYPILKQYRRMVSGLFPAGSLWISTLPRLTPKPGHTPAPVEASARWDADTGQARIEWEASEDARLRGYQVRYVPGDRYDSDDEAVVASIAPEAPRELLTLAGLGEPGARASFKVYVLTDTGNEKGGSPLLVERPDT